MLYWLTMQCKSGCPHCMQDCKETDESHATLEDTKRFMKFYDKIGSKKLLISGGEPTEHPNFDRHLAHILKIAKRKNVVFFATNGMFLSDPSKRKALSRICHKYPNLFVQVSNIKGLYPYYEQVKELLHKYRDSKIRILLTTPISDMQKLGRARQNWEAVKDFDLKYHRIAPNCFNMYSLAKVKGSFAEVLHFLSAELERAWCIPSIMGATGDIYAGETRFCTKIGNISDMGESAFEYLKNNTPCQRCRV